MRHRTLAELERLESYALRRWLATGSGFWLALLNACTRAVGRKLGSLIATEAN
jgi:hypothetical protein